MNIKRGTKYMTNSSSQLNLKYIMRPAQPSVRSLSVDGKTPGLLLLHGRGADEADLMGLETALDLRLTVVSARAPFRMGAGFAWYDMAQIGNPDEETFHAGLYALQEFIVALPEACNIDPQRLYLLGISQGAIMSAGLALTAPDKVRGVIMHSGYVHADSGLDIIPNGIEGKGFFVAHGIYDEVIPITYGRDTEAYLTAQNARLTYQEYPIGHGISEESLYDLSHWLTGELER